MVINANAVHREPWNKGKIVGQKAPFKVKDIWALRVRLQMESRVRELALFNLGIDSKLRGCDLVSLKVRDICHSDQVATRAVVMQLKTQRPVRYTQFASDLFDISSERATAATDRPASITCLTAASRNSGVYRRSGPDFICPPQGQK